MRNRVSQAVVVAVSAAGVLAGLLASPVPVLAQGEPQLLREPRGFDFTRDGVWRARSRRVAQAREAALARGDFASLNAALAARAPGANLVVGATPTSAMTVSGVLYAPVFLVQYKNTNAASLRLASEYFDALLAPVPTLGRPYTLRTFYEEMSNGLMSVQGQVIGWIQLDSNDTWYEGASNGLSGNQHMAQLIQEAVSKSDASVNYGQFDNDGPDGVPNSPDDDGQVDLVILVHPELDGACGPAASNRNIWSHRFAYSAWSAGQTLATADVRGSGTGVLRVNDYTIQSGVGGPLTTCDTTQVMSIGTTAHETGHGFGLPDFYDTNPGDADNSEGIGHWGLMSSGNYARPRSPAHMEGFSRLQLGWVTVRDLPTSGSYALGPYTDADTIYRVTPAGPNARNEYFLIENRQGTRSDSALIGLKGPGLLIFHVDPTKYSQSLFNNQVNSGTIHALNLMQADGLNHLGSSVQGVRNRGDAGDPFPGSTGNATFAVMTNPSVLLNDGTVPPIRIDSIRQVVAGGEMRFRLTLNGLTLVRASDTTALIKVRDVAFVVYRDVFLPGDTVSVSADSAQYSSDGRTRYLYTSWSDAGARSHVAAIAAGGGTLTANFSRAFQVQFAFTGSGTVTSSPTTASGSFIASGDSVTLTATPGAGVNFVGWTGDTSAANPVLTLRATRPFNVTAAFQSLLAVTDSALRGAVMGAPYQDTVVISGGSGGNAYAIQSGVLPSGMGLTQTGVLGGTPSETGAFNFVLRVSSAPQFLDLPLRLVVTAPTLAVNAVVTQLLDGGTQLTASELNYLDLLGNHNGSFDVGDFTAWLDVTGFVVSADVMRRILARSRR